MKNNCKCHWVVSVFSFALVLSGLSFSLLKAEDKAAAKSEMKAEKAEKAAKLEKSLYERLGGVYSIATVVDDFIERLLVNDTLNANPAIKEARDRVPKAGLKYRVTSLVAQVTGGPEKYAGSSMKESHKHLNITAKEWDAMAADFKKTLDKFNVPEKEQDELFVIIGTTKNDIVINPSTEGKEKK